MGKPSVTKACPYFIPLCLFYVLSLWGVLYALYFFFIGSQERPTPSFLKILRSTSESMTVE